MKAYSLLGAIMGLGIVLLAISQFSLSQKIAQANEEARPANLEVTIITPLECQDCFDPQHILAALGRQPAVITNEKTIAYPSEQANELIEKHNLTTLPVLLLSGETDKSNISSFLEPQTRLSDNVRIWSSVPPPHLNLETETVVGKVGLTLITKEDCETCYDVQTHEPILVQSFGMTISEKRTLDASSPQARSLIDAYKITAVPTVIISPDAAAYPSFVNAWKSVGSVEEDGSYIFRNVSVFGTYFDLGQQTLVEPQTS